MIGGEKMKVTTSDRLQYLMQSKNLNQSDILRLCHPICKKYGISIGKSALSEYVRGKHLPNQGKLLVLGEALNVNEAWLMGYDVPMEREPKKEAPTPESELTEYEQDILNLAKAIPEDKRKDFINYLQTAVKMMI